MTKESQCTLHYYEEDNLKYSVADMACDDLKVL